MELLEDGVMSDRLIRAFHSGYPHLALEVLWREGMRPSGVWKATVRAKSGGEIVATGVRHHLALAVGQALAGIPERYRRVGRA